MQKSAIVVDIYGYLLTLWMVKRPCIALSAHWLVVWGNHLQLSSRWGGSFCGVASVYCFIVSFLVSWHKVLSHVHTSGWILAGASVVFPWSLVPFAAFTLISRSARASGGGRGLMVAVVPTSLNSSLQQLKQTPFVTAVLQLMITDDNVTSRQYHVPKLLLDWADWLIFTLLSKMRAF